MLQPVRVRVELIFTDVDRCDRGRAQKLTTDGHSGTASIRSVQWPHTIHRYLAQRNCKFNANRSYYIRSNSTFPALNIGSLICNQF